jgi:hypothetical protein
MELLQRRKFCREFLNGYNEKLHPQIISKVFEIGLLTLKNRFNKLLFSKEELDEIIKDLSGKDYVEIVPLPPLKKIEKLPLTSQKRPPQQNEEYYFNTEIKNNNDDDILKTKIIRNKKLYDKTLQNPNFTTQNSAIYPNWWWNNKEEEEIEKPKRNINIIYKEPMTNDDNNDNYEYEEYEGEDNGEYIQVNEGRFENENETNFENYEERQNFENSEMKNKNYTIKKLTMNSGRPKRYNRYENNNLGNPDEEIFYEKPNKIPFNPKNMKSLKNAKKIPNQIKQKEIKQRVKSSKPPQRKINSFTKNTQPIKNKVIKKAPNISQGKKDVKLIKVPNYKYTYVNGRILRIPDANKKFMNLTMTEPNKY